MMLNNKYIIFVGLVGLSISMANDFSDVAFAQSAKSELKVRPIFLDTTKRYQDAPLNPEIDNMVTGSVEKEEKGVADDKPDIDTLLTTGSVASEEELMSYCYNISDSAVEARSAVLKERLAKVEMEIDKKLLALEEKTNELKAWMRKRDSFTDKTNDSVVKIFQSMRPDAAASQFAELGAVVSASIISKLDPKYSSAILTEMEPADAADIAIILTSSLKGVE